MSDENSKDRRPQRGPGRAATAPGGAKRTMIGLPVSDPRVAPDEPVRPGPSGQRPATPEAAPLPSPGNRPNTGLDDGYIADKLYMEPPSETFGRAPTHVAMPAPQHAPPPAHAAPPPREPEHAAPNFAATALRAAQAERGSGHNPAAAALHGAQGERGASHNPAGAALHAAQQTMQERMPAPRTSFSNPSAPEAWRNDVRRMADRGTTQAPPRPTAVGNASLRLKLDSAEPDDPYHGVPKSRLPSVLLWLFALAGLGGAAAYWVDEQGGLVAARTRLEGLVSGHPIAPPTITPAAAPSAEAPPTAAEPTTPPPTAAEPTTPPPTAAQAESAAQALADPEPPTAAPAKPEPVQAEAKPKPPSEEKPKPVRASKPAAPTPPAHKVVRHQPVITVKPIGSSATPPSSAPPEPAGTPYVPNIPEPPAPDEAR
jgi:hypothetical protein